MPTASIADLIEDRFGTRIDPGPDVPGAATLTRILARRTHRRYADRAVPDDLLQTLLACAFSASAKSDLQQSGVILVRDPAKRATIAGWIPDMPWIAQAPVFMVWIGDSRRIRRICELRGKPFGNDHLDSFLNATADCALAMQTFILAAEAAGLGSCCISAVRNHAQPVADLLEMPKWVFPVAGARHATRHRRRSSATATSTEPRPLTAGRKTRRGRSRTPNGTIWVRSCGARG